MATAVKMPIISTISSCLGKIDRRVRYLGKRLEELKIVDYAPRARRQSLLWRLGRN